MATIQKDDYRFEVDIEKTIEYYKMHSLCECECCENYYAQIKGKFPKLESFLADFGVDIAKPDECMSVELDNTIQYIGIDYTVCGKVINTKQCEINIEDSQRFSLAITEGFASPNEQTGDYFTISISSIFELPWVLDKPFPKPIQFKTTSKIKGDTITEYVVIPDTAIIAVNRGKQENESSNIVYRDKSGRLHSIDFDICSINYKAEHKDSSRNCIGERKADENYFVFYTSGIKTKVVFKKLYVGNMLCYHRLTGSKTARFLALQNLINETKYATYDLS